MLMASGRNGKGGDGGGEMRTVYQLRTTRRWKVFTEIERKN
jgi:hypothetical protein